MNDPKRLPVEVKFLLLTIIGHDGDIEDLNKMGYDFVSIKNLIRNEIEIGNASFDDNILILTEQGIKLRNEIAHQLNYQNIEKVVGPKLSSRMNSKIELNDVFIPVEDELDF